LIDTESMRAQTYPLSHAVEAFGAAAGRLKVLLEP
jgi:hypothetical protein